MDLIEIEEHRGEFRDLDQDSDRLNFGPILLSNRAAFLPFLKAQAEFRGSLPW